MKIVLLLTIALGFGATLAGAHFMPWLAHARLPSHTSVVANGGRSEQFLIRLPADRIAATDGLAGGLRAPGATQAMALPATFVAQPLLVEHFKVRNSSGSVIGVAARHWSTSSAGATGTWSVLIPSRGALVLTSPGEPPGALEAALRASGYGGDKEWSGRVTVTMTPPGDGGTVAVGTGEFEGLVGRYTESWTVSGIDEDGGLNATIEIETVTSRLP